MGESFKKMLWRNKRYSSFIKTALEVLVFFTPLLVPLLIQREWFFSGAGRWADILAIVLAIIFVVFVVAFCLQHFLWENKKQESYMPIVNEQIECICEDKYRALCREMDGGQRYKNGEILLYDAHASIRTILIYIKQLVSAITGVGLNNLSVSFVYKYKGEKWQEIDGSTATTMGNLNDLIEGDSSKTLYHHMIIEKKDYCYIHDKAKELAFKYTPSSRDGENTKKYGSIMCKRYKCMLHGEAAVDAMLSISSYGEKFSGFFNQKYIEQLLSQNISRYEWLIRTELAALYLRHDLRTQRQEIKKTYVITLLKTNGWLEDREDIAPENIDAAIRSFKEYVFQANGMHPYRRLTVDADIDEVLIANLETGNYRRAPKNETV